MSDKKNLEEIVKNKKDYTVVIIVGILVLSVVLLLIYVLDRNIKVESSKIFDVALDKINEFDTLPNLFSKQEMEKEVISLLDNVIAKYPNTPSGKRALFYKGYILFNVNNFEKAENNFKYFIDKNKKNFLIPKAYYFLSYCYSEMNDNDKAIKLLEEFVNEFKDSYYMPLILFRLANMYEAKKEKEKAITYYNKIIEDHPESSQKNSAREKKILLENNIEL